jgi:L-rhamnonate dehydratase
LKITDIRTRALEFSRSPVTLQSHMMSPTSHFDDHYDKSWFGPCSIVLVEVFTDEGIVGIGTAGGFTSSPKEIIDRHFKHLLIGENPLNNELLWEKMYRSSVRIGRKGPVSCAISGIDIALWDIKGKFFNTPVYNLLGGKTKEQIKVYASRLYALKDLDQLREEALEYKRQGFTMMKQRFGFGPRDGYAGMKQNEALVRTVREAVGDEVMLAADAYMGWDVAYTMEMAKMLEPYRLSWIEEPLMPHDIDGYAYLSKNLSVPFSCGEHEYTRWGFRDLIEKQAIRILQPDTNRVGGITEMLKICALASAHDLVVVPHSNEAHNLHLIASQPVCPFMEYFPNIEPDTGNEIFWKVFNGEPVAKNGVIIPTEKPGLGIEINEEAVAGLLLKPLPS